MMSPIAEQTLHRPKEELFVLFALHRNTCSNMRCMVYYLLLAFLFMILASQFVQAQNSLLNFKKYASKDGLLGEYVTCTVQDNDGYLWIGTTNGLYRFDGREFFPYKKTADTFSICGNHISKLYIDTLQRLWIATKDGGLCYFNNKQRQFLVPEMESKLGGTVLCLYALSVTAEGRMFLCGEKCNQLYIDLYERHPIIKLFAKEAVTAYEIFAIDSISAWVCHVNGQLTRYVNGHGNYWQFRKSPGRNIITNRQTVSCMVPDGQRNYWCGAWDNALHKFDSNGKYLASFIFDGNKEITHATDEITCLQFIDSHTLWIGTKHNGLLAFDVATQNFSSLLSGQYIFTEVNSIYKDYNQHIWIGTPNGLLVYSHQNDFFNVVQLPSSSMRPVIPNCFFRFNDTTLWIGTNNGMTIQSGSKFEEKKFFSEATPQSVHRVLKTSDGNYYLGTQETIMKLNPHTLTATTTDDTYCYDIKHHSFTRVTTLDELLIGNQAMIWSTFYGHTSFLTELNTFNARMLFAGNIATTENLIRKFYKDSKGRLWVLGSTYGILRVDSIFNNKTYKVQEKLSPYYSEAFAMADVTKLLRTDSSIYYLRCTYCTHNKRPHIAAYSDMYDMVEFNDSTFYVTTTGSGLCTFNPTTQSLQSLNCKFTNAQGLYMDGKRNIWFVANNTLVHYNPTNKQFTYYDEQDGLPTNGLRGYLYEVCNGELAVATINGYLSFNPNRSAEVHEELPFRFTHFSLFDNNADSLLQMRNPAVAQHYNNINFQFSFFDLVNPASIHYSYMLQGQNNVWIDNGNNNKISFTNLSGGTYNLKVRARYKNADTTIGEISYAFNIIPHWYLTWWFYGSIAIAMATGIYFFYRYRLQQIHKFYAMRNKIARDLHDDVGATLSSISMGAQMMKHMIPEGNSDERKIIETMNKAALESISNMGDIVWSLNPSNDKAEAMVKKMKRTMNELFEHTSVQVHFVTSPELNSMPLDMVVRKNIFLIFKEALNNAAKYAHAQNLYIDLQLVEGNLLLKIADDGDGFDVGNSNPGNGLGNMHTRAVEIGARYGISSHLGTGTTVVVEAPLPKIHDKR